MQKHFTYLSPMAINKKFKYIFKKQQEINRQIIHNLPKYVSNTTLLGGGGGM